MRNRRPNRRGDSRRGSSMVEFALTGLLFMAVIVGAFELGRALWIYNTLAYASARGVRYAMVRGASNSSPATATDIETYVQSQATGLSADQLTVTTTWSPDNSQGSFVQVEAKYPIVLIGYPLFLANGPSGISLAGRATHPIIR